MRITILYFVKHFDRWEKHVFNFLSFKVVLFIVIATEFQKTNNFYKLCSFNHFFSIWKSFLDTKKKIVSVPLQKLASYLGYKMIVEVDCALITVYQGVYLKACYLNIIQIKTCLHLPILPNSHSQSIPHFLGISLVFASHLNRNVISRSNKFIIYNAFQQQNYALDVYNCIINQILISLKL